MAVFQCRLKSFVIQNGFLELRFKVYYRRKIGLPVQAQLSKSKNPPKNRKTVQIYTRQVYSKFSTFFFSIHTYSKVHCSPLKT